MITYFCPKCNNDTRAIEPCQNCGKFNHWHICSNCFAKTNTQYPCFNCGSYPNQNSGPNTLKIRTTLRGNNGILVGKTMGSGGFGITYMGFELNLERKVIIKEYLPLQIASRSDNQITVTPSNEYIFAYNKAINNFIKEAKTLARLDHKNIVKILDYFDENNTAYFTMPYVDGITLEQYVIANNGITEKKLLQVMRDVLSGLEEVHKQGEIHRDVKPSNIFLPVNGPALLLDFGASRQYVENLDAPITRLFTPGYAPFEQIQTENRRLQGPWTDIYACSATMYSCLSASIENGSLKAPLSSYHNKGNGKSLVPIVQVSTTTISRKTGDAIMRGLEDDISARPQSAQEFLNLLHITEPINSELPAMDKNFAIYGIEGDYKGQAFYISEKPIVFGRDPSRSAVVFDDLNISKIHFEIYTTNGIVFIKDLGSLQGTFINDEIRIPSYIETFIGNGSIVNMAGTQVFRLIDTAEEKEIYTEQPVDKKLEKNRVTSKKVIQYVIITLIIVIIIILLSTYLGHDGQQ